MLAWIELFFETVLWCLISTPADFSPAYETHPQCCITLKANPMQVGVSQSCTLCILLLHTSWIRRLRSAGWSSQGLVLVLDYNHDTVADIKWRPCSEFQLFSLSQIIIWLSGSNLAQLTNKTRLFGLPISIPLPKCFATFQLRLLLFA